MITADNITDEQIHELRGEARDRADYTLEDLCTEALYHDEGGRRARARCAEILSARMAAKESK